MGPGRCEDAMLDFAGDLTCELWANAREAQTIRETERSFMVSSKSRSVEKVFRRPFHGRRSWQRNLC
jgi:hypothetical protein